MTSVSEESNESGLPGSSDALPSETEATGLKAFLASFEKLPELPWDRNWGLLQIGLGVVTVFASTVVGVSIGSFFAGPEALEAYRSGEATPGVIAVCALGVFQLSMFLWPFIVSAVWHGRGVVKDWGFQLKLTDLSTGLAAALVALVAVPMMARLMSAIVGLEDQSEAGNTDFLKEAEGSPWLFALIFGATIGAPVVEEIFFRGFIQRSLERFGGQIVGVLGSTVLFALPHFTGAALKPTIVLLVSISVVGLLFGTMAAVTRRLGPSIVAHILFNSTVVAFTVLG